MPINKRLKRGLKGVRVKINLLIAIIAESQSAQGEGGGCYNVIKMGGVAFVDNKSQSKFKFTAKDRPYFHSSLTVCSHWATVIYG